MRAAAKAASRNGYQHEIRHDPARSLSAVACAVSRHRDTAAIEPPPRAPALKEAQWRGIV